MLGPEWKKPSRSGGSGNCVEVRQPAPGEIELRDSKDPDGPTLRVPAGAFAEFVRAVVAGGRG